MNQDVPPAENEPQSAASVRYLWPVFEWWSDSNYTLRAVRPFYTHEADDSERWSETDVIWPFIQWRSEDIGTEREEFKIRILPLFQFKRQTSPDLTPWRMTLFPLFYAGRTGPSPDQYYRILFPFWWEANNSRVYFPIFWTSERSFRALFPLWGYFEDLWGRDEFRFILWPLWIRSHRGEAVTHSLIWPFFGHTSGGGESGWRAWPLFGWRTVEERGTRGFFLWPIGHFRRETLPDGRPNNLFFIFPTRFKWDIGDNHLNVHWPFWGTYKTPGHESWSIAWPLYMHTINHRHSWVEDRVLWFLFRRRVGDDERAFDIMPLYGHREWPNREVRYVLFPIFTEYHRDGVEPEGDNPGRRGRRLNALLPLFVRTSSWLGENPRVARRSFTWVFPLFLQREREDGTERIDWLWPLLMTQTRGYDHSWGAFFRIIESGETNDGASWLRLMWHLYVRSEDAEGRVESDYNGLLIHRHRDGDARRLRLLGGVATRISDVDGQRWTWFNFGEESDEN